MYLSFSDSAKFAEVAGNLLISGNYGSKFSFFGSGVFSYLKSFPFPVNGILPVTPFSITAFFKIFGITDFQKNILQSLQFLQTASSDD